MRGIDFSLVKLVPCIADDITKMMIWACTDTLDVTPGVKNVSRIILVKNGKFHDNIPSCFVYPAFLYLFTNMTRNQALFVHFIAFTVRKFRSEEGFPQSAFTARNTIETL